MNIKSLSLIFLFIFILACEKNIKQNDSFSPISKVEIRDVAEILQNSGSLNFDIPKPDLKLLTDIRKDSRARFFDPWHRKNLTYSKDDITVKKENLKKRFSENLMPLQDTFIEEIINNSDYASYGKVNSPGIMLETTDLRVMPTNKPSFDDPSTAGNGYPFDMFQESQLSIGVPVLISYYSKDGAWALVETNESCYGWVKSGSVSRISKKDIKIIESLPQAILIKDNQGIYSGKKTLKFQTRIGTYLPIRAQNKNEIQVMVPSLNSIGNLIWRKYRVPRDAAVSIPFDFTEKNLKYAVDSLINKNYGWGTYLGNRDCSAMIHDFYALFGIWLPRNSGSQSTAFGKIFNLDKKSDIEKYSLVKEEGVPFQTIFYRPGHIVIYAGNMGNKILIFHAVWGVKTRMGDKTGRNIIGRSVISTIEYGSEVPNYDEQSGSFLHNMTRMTVLLKK